ncbi:hypothetical protein [Microbacterium sp. LWH10-1.2]|uniref:hypothetical protein n=1 Tax=Microbacterium sp. LWH10-1.2 TaxID=3135255 RepID=UPI0031387A11
MTTTWYSVATPEEAQRLLSAWSDAPVENAELCGFLLDIAKDQVLAYAPAQTPNEAFLAALEDDAVPARYVYAQLEQAKNLWNAGRAQQDGGVGAEGYSFTPRPLDKTIRSIIRPTSGVADVF